MIALRLRALFIGASALPLAACVDRYVDVEPDLVSFAVEVTAPLALGTPEEPLSVPRGPTSFSIAAQAYGRDGQPFHWNGRARIHVTPGAAAPDLAAPGTIDFVDGAGTATVKVVGVHSETRIWVIDDAPGGSQSVGVTPIVHFDEPSLADINTIPPQGDNQTSFFIEDGQRGDFVRMGRDGALFATRENRSDSCTLAEPGPTKRDLIVTSITDRGFYVTDLSEPALGGHPGNFGHLYVYNFNFPEGLQVGDRLEALEGTIQEFSGHTQLSFPVYRASSCDLLVGDDVAAVRAEERAVELAALAALEAQAPAIDSALCQDTSGGIDGACGYSARNFRMESLESALVKLAEVRTPEMWVRCDFDGDGQASNFGVNGCTNPKDAECLCNWACQTSGVFPPPNSELEAAYADRAFDAGGKVCSERTGYDSFGQYIVRLVEPTGLGPRINVSTRMAFPDFDPELEENLGSLLRVRGILQHVRAARPRWVVHARIPDERNAFDLCCLTESDCPTGLQLCTF